MRLTKLFATACAAALLAAGGAAQEAEPAPDEERRLPGLDYVLDGLSDELPAVEAQAEEQPRADETDAVTETGEEEEEPEAEERAEQAPPAPPAAPPQPLTRAQIAELAERAARGRQIAAIAGAGQMATQDMLSRVSDPEGAGISGWIAEPEGNGTTVTFYADDGEDAPPSVVYRVTILGGRVTAREVFLTPAQRPPLRPLQARMAAARNLAEAQGHEACGAGGFNYLIVPPSAPSAPIVVYQISAQTARGRYPVGGHFRTTVAADGSLVESRGFTNVCVALDAPPVSEGQRAPPPAAIVHLLDPMPTEIHVFLSLWAGRPLVVVADDPQRLFAVTGEGIAEIPPEEAAR